MAFFSLKAHSITLLLAVVFSTALHANPTIVTSETLPNAEIGIPYSVQFAATGGVAPYTWVLSGGVPSGLTFDAAKALLNGTPAGPLEGGFGFTLQVTDAQGGTVTKNFSFQIGGPPHITTTSPLYQGTVGGLYNLPISALGYPPRTLAIISGSLPPGLMFYTDSNVIFGTPTAAGTYIFTMQVTDALGGHGSTDLSLTINPALVITTSAIPNATLGTPYSVQLMSTGGTLPLNWSASTSSHTYPAGLSFGYQGTLSGTPAETGTFPITFIVSDSAHGLASKDFTLTINPPTGFTIITGSPLPTGTVGSAYPSTLFTAYSGTGPITWWVASGQLPPGLSLTSYGLLGGTPSAFGDFNFTIRATDSQGLKTTKDFTLSINRAPFAIVTTAVANAVTGMPYQQQIIVTGGIPPYQFFVGMSLPVGLNLDSSTGIISGTTAGPSKVFSITVVDSVGLPHLNRNFVLVVSSSFTITSDPLLPAGTVQRPYSYQLASQLGTAPLTWAISSGSLPSGLTLDPANGIVSGFPSEAGTFTFTVSATDHTNANATQTFTTTIASNPITITTPSLPSAIVNTNYSQTLLSSGGTPPVTWSLASGALPPTLILNPSTGTISGLLATAGSFPFTAKVTDSTGAFATKPFLLQIYSSYAISADRSTIQIGANLNGTVVTSPQNVAIHFTPSGSVPWTVTTTDSNIIAIPTSGVGDALIGITAKGSGAKGKVTINAPQATPATLDVNVVITADSDLTPPFGSFDTPLDKTTAIAGAIPVTGWALDHVEVSKVDIWREPVSNEPQGLLVYIGDSVFVSGARPDVQALYPNLPLSDRAGWGYLMLTNFLPNSTGSGPLGNGTYKLHSIAHNKTGASIDLGTKTITVDNAHAAKPFGSIDTPGQGGTASGNDYVNFGWALTQNPLIIPVDGSTITVYIDGKPVGHPTYSQFRSDIAGLFPGLANSGGAVGFFHLDTTSLANGVHTISWTVYDNAGHGDGIGSRYFNIVNSNASTAAQSDDGQPVTQSDSSLTVRHGYDLDTDREMLTLDENNEYTVDMEELGRIELRVGGAKGYQLVNGKRWPLPSGSSMKNGVFYWQLGPGFLGEYQLIFEKSDQSLLTIRVRVGPKR